MKGIDNQDNVGENQDLHAGIDNQGPVVEEQPNFGAPNQNQMGGNPMGGNPMTGKPMGGMGDNVINQINNTPINPSKNALTTSFGACPQCGLSHPPLRQGETCPNASVQTQDTNAVKITDLEFNKFLIDIKNILVSQLGQLEVTNPKDIFQTITMKVMEGLEELKKK